jgi:hypothetical protein
MPKKVSGFEAKYYSINCKENDRVDIRCGGPQFLGFDFHMDSELEESEVIDKKLALVGRRQIVAGLHPPSTERGGQPG